MSLTEFLKDTLQDDEIEFLTIEPACTFLFEGMEEASNE